MVDSVIGEGLPEVLVEACASQQAVLVAGSGVDASSGGKTWSDYAHHLIAEGRRAAPARDWDGLLEHLQQRRNAAVSEALHTWLSRDRLEAAAWSQLPDTGGDSPLVRALRAIPFAAALSLTWSDLVFEAFAEREPVSVSRTRYQSLASLLQDDEFGVLSIWGRLGERNAIFSPAELRSVLYENPTLRRVAASLFASRSWVFVGASVASVAETLDTLVPAGISARAHFALVVDDESAEQHELDRLAQHFGLKVLFFENSDAVAAATAQLARAVKGHATAGADRSQLLRRVQLDNIGPFSSVEFECHSGCTVLLGDNGSGKSSVLKAIALALCGDSDLADDLAEQLLSAEADEGRIRIELGNDTLETRLVRIEGRVRVSASGMSPVQSGTVLAMAFPPVRGVSVGDPAKVGRHVPRGPRVEDLAPILQGPVDHRIDDLKQWVVDTAVTDEGDELISQLFDLIRSTTPGHEYVFEEVAANQQVILRTPSGRLPFEGLSQGLTSTLGWVGSLARRINDVSALNAKTGRRVIVLVDEVDAHLHPDWQRNILGLVRIVFPSVQLVVTTHSPLVVGSLVEGSVYSVGGADGPLTIELLDIDFEGWRADQILTSEAFKLVSTRSPFVSEKLSRLRELKALTTRSEAHQEEIRRLDAELKTLLPSPLESPDDRAFDGVIGAAVESEIEKRPEAERAQLLERLKAIVNSESD